MQQLDLSQNTPMRWMGRYRLQGLTAGALIPDSAQAGTPPGDLFGPGRPPDRTHTQGIESRAARCAVEPWRRVLLLISPSARGTLHGHASRSGGRDHAGVRGGH